MKRHSANRNKFITENEPELRGLRVLFGVYGFFVIASIVMPQYFGVHVGYDITCARLSNLLFILYMILNPPIMTHFFRTAFRCEIFYPLCIYLVVAGYTMVFRGDLNAFFLVFLEVFSLFMMVYGIRYVIGYRRAIKWVTGCAYFLGFYGLIEFAYGKSIFLQFLKTMDTPVVNSYRSGHYRIMGPCGHSLGYGLVLLLFIAIACADVEKKELYLFRRPVLLVVLYANVFLTGSRSTLGIAMLEMALIFVFSGRENIKKSLFYLFVAVVGLGFFLALFYNTGLGRYLMGQIASVVDHAFGTSYAANFGIDVTTLKNSEEYRKALPYIFKLSWLNPLVGRGMKAFNGATVNGIYVHSIDNYYVSQYIKYAYPGMISYILFMLTTLVVLLREWFKKNSAVSAVAKFTVIGVVLYYVNLWWVDALQTLKYVYVFIAIFYAAYLEEKDMQQYLFKITGDKTENV